jgi:raffinose/stachyose/melibiose transport system substrate-binding protein
MSFRQQLRARLGLGILVVVFCLALLRVFTLQSRKVATDKKVIKIVHWQLEAGIGEGIDEICGEYEKVHPDVDVQQIRISERGYGSWVTTRLIGGTAPDLVEMGMMEGPLMHQMWQRYFLPLSGEIVKPNPYNKGTPLEGVPWKDTYYDGMAGGFVPPLLEYYQVPSSAHTMRLFYNKVRWREATGMDAPPQDFRGFIAACERIKEYGRRRGEILIPIAGSRYNSPVLFDRFTQAVGSSLLATSDINRDGELTPEENIITLVGGAVDFRDPRIRAMFTGREYYRSQFQPAFFAAERMDAGFLFIQQRALMITSGSWDAGSYMKQADFEIGICDFPLPSKDDPEFGRFVEGPAVEELQGGFSFSVNRLSPHVDVALDFMRFMTSQTMNDRLNRSIRWMPIVRGNKPDPFIAPFWPNLDGVKPGLYLETPGANGPRYHELMNLHSAGRIDFEGFLAGYLPAFVSNCDQWMRVDRDRNARLADNQDEFRKTIQWATAQLSGSDQTKAATVLEGALARRYADIEYAQRYEEARARTPLPTGGGK